MAWMPKSEAAAALGLSPLILSRQIAVGRFRTKTVGRKVLVDVGDVEKQRCSTNGEAEPRNGSRSKSHLPYEPPPAADVAEPATDCESAAPAPRETERMVATELPPPADETPVLRPREQFTSLHEEEILTATLDAVDKVRAYCDQESGLARAEAEQAWSSCEKAERRLRRVAFVTATVFVGAIVGVGWLDRIHTAERTQWRAKTEEAQAAVASEHARQQGDAESIRAAFDAYRIEAEQTTETLQETLTKAQAELAASQNEIDRLCWERDQAIHDRDRLASEIASRPDHNQRLQGIEANAAAKSLKDLLDETWDPAPQGGAAPTGGPDTSTGAEPATRLTVGP